LGGALGICRRKYGLCWRENAFRGPSAAFFPGADAIFWPEDAIRRTKGAFLSLRDASIYTADAVHRSITALFVSNIFSGTRLPPGGKPLNKGF